MTLDNGTDGQTDRRTDRVRRNMWPPPREEGRIKMQKLKMRENVPLKFCDPLQSSGLLFMSIFRSSVISCPTAVSVYRRARGIMGTSVVDHFNASNQLCLPVSVQVSARGWSTREI